MKYSASVSVRVRLTVVTDDRHDVSVIKVTG